MIRTRLVPFVLLVQLLVVALGAILSAVALAEVDVRAMSRSQVVCRTLNTAVANSFQPELSRCRYSRPRRVSR